MCVMRLYYLGIVIIIFFLCNFFLTRQLPCRIYNMIMTLRANIQNNVFRRFRIISRDLFVVGFFFFVHQILSAHKSFAFVNKRKSCVIIVPVLKQ